VDGIVLNVHLNVFHLHLIQLFFLLRVVAVYKALPLRGRGHISSVLVGSAVGHLGVVALIGEVAEPFLLKPKASL